MLVAVEVEVEVEVAKGWGVQIGNAMGLESGAESLFLKPLLAQHWQLAASCKSVHPFGLQASDEAING